jgi:hypothetical protein
MEEESAKQPCPKNCTYTHTLTGAVFNKLLILPMISQARDEKAGEITRECIIDSQARNNIPAPELYERVRLVI